MALEIRDEPSFHRRVRFDLGPEGGDLAGGFGTWQLQHLADARQRHVEPPQETDEARSLDLPGAVEAVAALGIDPRRCQEPELRVDAQCLVAEPATTRERADREEVRGGGEAHRAPS